MCPPESQEIDSPSGDVEDDSEEVGLESGEDLLSPPESQEVQTPTDPDSFISNNLGKPSL